VDDPNLPEPSETDCLLGEKPKEKKKNGRKPSLLKVLVKMYGWKFLLAMICKLLHDSFVFVQPQLLRWVQQTVLEQNNVRSFVYRS